MLGFFQKKQPRIERVNHFWDWFANNSERIIESLHNEKQKKLWENIVGKALRHIYKFDINKEMKFDFSQEQNKSYFYLYPNKHSYFIELANMINETIPNQLNSKWTVIIKD